MSLLDGNWLVVLTVKETESYLECNNHCATLNLEKSVLCQKLAAGSSAFVV